MNVKTPQTSVAMNSIFFCGTSPLDDSHTFVLADLDPAVVIHASQDHPLFCVTGITHWIKESP